METFGFNGPDVDAELLLLTARLWQHFGIADALTLEINTLGTVESRAKYRQALVDYLMPLKEQLDEDSQRRLSSNPLRILDSKNQDTQALLNDAPTLADFLEPEVNDHFKELQRILDAASVSYRINPRLVRGLDYYDYTVFEWVTDKLGAQGTICAGGRYNGLVEQLGGKSTPAVGFAMGVERLALLLDTLKVVPANITTSPDIYVVCVGDVLPYCLSVTEQLRSALSSEVIAQHCGGGSAKNQLKKADKSGAAVAVIVGETEAANSEVTIKYLREDKPQETLRINEFIQQYMA